MGRKNLKLRELFNVNDVPEKFLNFEFPLHLATDSRDVKLNGAFVALEGSKVDGHNFINQALDNGAKLIIAKKNKNLNVPENIPVITLDDPEKDLSEIAALRLEKFPPREIIAITGSVGKTSTRAALEKILSSHFKIHAPERSFNTLIGCSSTILGMPEDIEILILEFGANKPGEIKELTEHFKPTTAILTEIAPVHLEGFKNIDGVAHEKLEITKSKNLKRVIFNSDNEYLKNLNGVSVGKNKNSDYQINFEGSNYELPDLKFRILHENKTAEIISHVWGNHMAVPLSLAFATGNTLGLSFEDCADELKNFEALPGRGRVIFLSGNKFIIDDAYNANPASMSASLETFAEIKIKNKAVILGEMRELGENAVKYHAGLKNLLSGIEKIILVGGLWRDAFNNDPEYIYLNSWQEALSEIKKFDWSGILIKGSNSIGLSNIVKAL